MVEFIKNDYGSIITVLGFLFTFLITKYSCKNDIEKLRREKMMEKIDNIPMKLLNIMGKIEEKDNDKRLLEFTEIMNGVISYCSKNSVKIVAYIQENIYQGNFKTWDLLGAYSILISQLKYELIGEYVSPKFYFKIKFKEHDLETAANIKTEVNKIVRKLNLSKKLLII